MAISKTDFVRALQCPKMLWLDKHKPQERVITEEEQQKLDAGNAFGDRAMGMFGDYAETTAYRADGRLDYKAMLETTERLIASGAPVICEAAFSYYGNYCAADILKKEAGGYRLYEVKNSLSVKDVFLADVGFQKYLLRKCGVKVTGVCLVLNDGADHPVVEDVTKRCAPFERLAAEKVWEFSKIKKAETELSVAPGEQCLSPYRCWYFDYCHKGK